MLVKNVADEVARTGVQVNAVGTNFMDFPAFLKASGATDPEVRAKIESQVPMKRLGTMTEFAAFCMAFLMDQADLQQASSWLMQEAGRKGRIGG